MRATSRLPEPLSRLCAAPDSLLAGTAIACGLGLVLLTPASGWAAPLWFGPGLYLGPYLVLLGGLLAWPVSLPDDRAWRSAALGALAVCAVTGAMISIGRPPGAPQAAGMLLPWPAGAIGTLALAALLVRLLPLSQLRWAQVGVALLLVPPLLLAFSYVVVVNRHASSSRDLGWRLSVAACVAALGLALAAASILLKLWRRSAAQPGRDARDDGTSLGLTLAVSLGLPLALACGAVLGGIAAARHSHEAEVQRQRVHLEGHGRKLQEELVEAGVRRVFLRLPENREEETAADGHLIWRSGQWWIQRAGATPTLSAEAASIFDLAHAAKSQMWICEYGRADRRCWVQTGDGPPNNTSGEGDLGTAEAIVVTLPDVGLQLTQLRVEPSPLEGALGAMRALLGPALAFAAVGVLLTVALVLPMVRRLERLRHRLAVLLENVPAAVLTVDASGMVAAANPAACKLFGLGFDPAPVLDDELARVVAAATAAGQADNRGAAQVGWSAADGKRHDIEVSAHAVPGDANRTLVLLANDVTRRNQAEARLQRAVKWSDAVLRAAGEGICVVARSGDLLLTNPLAQDLLGLQATPAPTVAAPCPVPEAIAGRWRAMVDEVLLHSETRRGEFCLDDVQGTRRCVAYVAAPFDEMLDGLVVVLRDVSAQHRTRRALDFATALLRRTEEVGRIGSWHLDLRTGKQTWSEGNLRIHGLPPEAEPSSELHMEHVHPDDRDRLTALIQDALERKVDHEVRYRMIVDGKVKWIEGRGSFTFDADGNAISWSGSIQDISDLQRRERELLASRRRVRELAARREREREEERARLAREVHDELGQQLTALRHALHRLEASERVLSEDAARQMALVKQQINRTVAAVRSIVQHLRPAMLDYGLAAAVEWLAEDFRSQHGVMLHLRSTVGDTPVLDEVGMTVFRCLQEALSNVARHAGALTVRVDLAVDADNVVLGVTDDGVGFDPADVRRRKTFGLMGMRERTLALGGSLEIHSHQGKGTRLVLRVPLRPAQPDSQDTLGELV